MCNNDAPVHPHHGFMFVGSWCAVGHGSPFLTIGTVVVAGDWMAWMRLQPVWNTGRKDCKDMTFGVWDEDKRVIPGPAEGPPRSRLSLSLAMLTWEGLMMGSKFRKAATAMPLLMASCPTVVRALASWANLRKPRGQFGKLSLKP